MEIVFLGSFIMFIWGVSYVENRIQSKKESVNKDRLGKFLKEKSKI